MVVNTTPPEARFSRLPGISDRPPRRKSIRAGRQRPHARRVAAADSQQLVVNKPRRNVLLVVLKLPIRLPKIRSLVGRILEFHDGDRHAIQKHDQIGAAREVAALDGELVNDQQVVF